MLQPVPARLFFRVLEAPLGVAAVVVGSMLARIGVSAMPGGWLWIGFALAGPAIAIFGVLGLIHATTGCLPEWVVGRHDDSAPDLDPPAA